MPRKTDKISRTASRSRKKGSAGEKTASKKSVAKSGPKTRLPSKDEILNFIAQATHKVGKREICRAFHIKGGARIALKHMLAELEEEGILTGGRKELRKKGHLPPVCVIEVFKTDSEGDLLARPVVWNEKEGEKPTVRLLTVTANPRDRERSATIAIGDKVLATINRLDEPEADGISYEATAIKRLSRETGRLLGIFKAHPKGGGTIEPISKKALRSWQVHKALVGDAKDGDLVRFELGRKGRFAQPQAKIVEALGNPKAQNKISLIAIHALDLPDEFPKSVLEETNHLPKLSTTNREDLTKHPFITIDPPDARDHDDAVFAQPDQDPKNPGGHIVWVAIADVAHYIRVGSQLDHEAHKRANSIYFPDRVVPMLPEKISNDLCSLKEGEKRPALVVKMVFDQLGKKRGHKFMRAMICSHAKLSYQEAQAAIDGNPDARTSHLLEDVLTPLWNAYGALIKARDKRSPLDLDLPERKIILNEKGQVERITIPQRLDAHRLIEEFMIQANVSAAEALEKKTAPLIYRRHDSPSDEKLKSVRDFLETLNLKLPPGGSLRPQAFNKILQRAKSMPVAQLVNEVILRSQAQAEYNPENAGHFGLNLARYAHFTSPIRRYADLLIHRALITAFNMGDDGFEPQAHPKLAEIAKHISETERRTMAAERETTDRLIAAHLSKQIGATFHARIAGVTRSGLFVRLDETGADGFIPASTIGEDYYEHVEEAHALIGQQSNLAYRIGDRVEVRLTQAIPSAGALRFEMLSEGKKYHISREKRLSKRTSRRRQGSFSPRQPQRGRNRRH